MDSKKVIDLKVGDLVRCNCGRETCKFKKPAIIKSFLPMALGVAAIFSEAGKFPIEWSPIDQLELAEPSGLSINELEARHYGVLQAIGIAKGYSHSYSTMMEKLDSLQCDYADAIYKISKSREVPTPGDVLSDSVDELLDDVVGLLLGALKKAMEK